MRNSHSAESVVRCDPAETAEGGLVFGRHSGGQRWNALAAKFTKFGLAGFPLQLVGLVLNYLLVRVAGMPKPSAYAIVVGSQLVVGFMLCTRWVFDTDQRFSVRRFRNFAVLMFSLRGLDWAAYTLLVKWQVPFLLAQIGVVGLLCVPKFVLLRLLFEPGKRPEWMTALRERFRRGRRK